MSTEIEILELEHEWRTHPRWARVTRPYRAADVLRLRGSLRVEHAPACRGAEKLWDRLHSGKQVHALGALTGDQAVQMARAGLEAIWVSGWHVAADHPGETALQHGACMPSNVASLVRRFHACLERADGIHEALGRGGVDWHPSIVADAEAGSAAGLDPFELTQRMIGAGAACVRFEDRLPFAKRRHHRGGAALAPTQEVIQKLVAARFAADVLGAPTILMARTGALRAGLLASDADPRDRPFLAGDRTPEGFFPARAGTDQAVARAIAYAPYADVLWCETSAPDLDEARRFARAVHARLPGKLLAYDCSPSFDWRERLDAAATASLQRELAGTGYRFQLVTLAGFHALDLAMFDLASRYRTEGVSAFARPRKAEPASEERGSAAAKPLRPEASGFRLVAG